MTVTTSLVTVRINKNEQEKVMVLAESDINYLSEQILLIAIGKVESKLNQESAAQEPDEEAHNQSLLARLDYPAR